MDRIEQIARRIIAGSLTAWHGTSDAYFDIIRESGGLNSPFLAATADLAEYYAEEAVEEHGGRPVVLEVSVRDTSRLRHDYAAMDELVTVGVDEDDRDAEWNRAEEEHPEWASNDIISIPSEAWEYSWRGAHSVWYDGLLPLSDISGIPAR